MKSRIAVCAVALFASFAGGKELEASSVLACNKDAQWEQLYDEIEGTTFEEKSRKAHTTLEMKAVAEQEIHLQEQELCEVARALFDTLDEEGQTLFLETHAAWKKYIALQAAFVTDSIRNGSARGIYCRAVLSDEIKWRTELYREMLAGRGIATTGFCMFPSP